MGLKELVRVELKQHESARSTDPDMLDFLHHYRVKQPSRELVTRFFADRILSKDLCKAATAAKTFEAQHEGMRFTFLTVTNRGSVNLNAAAFKAAGPSGSHSEGRGKRRCRGSCATANAQSSAPSFCHILDKRPRESVLSYVCESLFAFAVIPSVCCTSFMVENVSFCSLSHCSFTATPG